MYAARSRHRATVRHDTPTTPHATHDPSKWANTSLAGAADMAGFETWYGLKYSASRWSDRSALPGAPRPPSSVNTNHTSASSPPIAYSPTTASRVCRHQTDISRL